MLGERLALNHQAAFTIRRLVRLGNDDPAAARLAARALAAGLDPGSDTVEKIIGLIGDSGKGPDSSCGNSGSGDREDRKREADEGYLCGSDAGSGTETEHTLVRVLKKLAAEAVLDEGLAALASPGPYGDGWVCIPFKVPYHGVDFEGIIRIWYDCGAIRAGRLVADIRTGDERRLLDVREEGGGRVLRYHADDKNERKVFAEAFDTFGTVITGDLESGYLSELEQGLTVDRDA
jgi:hypothetical protein